MAIEARAVRASPVIQEPDYVAVVKQTDKRVVDQVAGNPVYKAVIEGDATSDQRVAAVDSLLSAGLEDGSATEAVFDKRRAALLEINAFIQTLRRQLGGAEAKAITDKSNADLHKILTMTDEDVTKFVSGCDPIFQLADLLDKYGAEGNIVEKLSLAKTQKAQRDREVADWTRQHNLAVATAEIKVADLEKNIEIDSQTLARRWVGRKSLEGSIAEMQADLETAKQNLEAEKLKTPPDPSPDVEQVDEGILDMVNISGQPFRDALIKLRDNTEMTLAKISTNFDEASTGLMNNRESFISMDRTCSDAIMALTVLEQGVRSAETKARTIAERLVKPVDGTSELDRMERERRSNAVLTYTGALTSFVKELGLAVASLRQSQATYQNILRMNQLAIEDCNSQKITGIANTADSVTIVIGSIVDACNRAASRTLADGLARIRQRSDQGTAQLTQGTTQALEQQNRQLAEFTSTVQTLQASIKSISANTVEALKKQAVLVGQMRDASDALAKETSNAQELAFLAQAGVTPEKAAEAPVVNMDHPFGLHVLQH